MANPTQITQPHRILDMSGLAVRLAQIQDEAGNAIGGATQQATIADLVVTDDTLAVTDDTLAVTDIDALAGIIKVVSTVVASSGGEETAVETALFTIPAACLILSIMADVTVAFDGTTIQTFEVGLTGNIDKYIDTADFAPETIGQAITNQESTTADQNTAEATGDTAMAVVSTHTNTGTASVGSVRVTCVYVEATDHDLGTDLAAAFAEVETSINTGIAASFAEVETSINTGIAASFAEVETKVNAILTALENAGLVADA